MKYIIRLKYSHLTDEELLADIKRTAKKLGQKHLTAKEYSRSGRYSDKTIAERFGSWNYALVKAGLKVKKLRYVTDDELFMELKRVWDKLGRQPNHKEMKKPLSIYCPSTYRQHFGSWNNALLVFAGKMKSPIKKYTRQMGRIKHAVKDPRSKITKSMRFDIMRRDNFKCRLCGASPAVDPKVRLHVDHIIPLSKGGGENLENLQTLCEDCNLGKGAKEITNRK